LSSIAQAEEQPCATNSEDLIGHWQYTQYIYQGRTHPRPNPKLLLYFDFHKTGSNRIWWTRTNEDGFCERVGSYTYNTDRCEFTDEVVWVNPNNNRECASDPDMQMGNIATSRLEKKDENLHLYFTLKGEPFIYVFEQVTK